MVRLYSMCKDRKQSAIRTAVVCNLKVLDYKIRELKAQIDPKTADIASMKTQTQAGRCAGSGD